MSYSTVSVPSYHSASRGLSGDEIFSPGEKWILATPLIGAFIGALVTQKHRVLGGLGGAVAGVIASIVAVKVMKQARPSYEPPTYVAPPPMARRTGS